MRRFLISLLSLSLLWPLSLFGQPHSQILTNQDVVGMVKAGLTPDIVIAKIKSSQESFDTSPIALEKLKKAGVPGSVILAIVQAPEQKVYVRCKFGKVGIHSDSNIESSIAGWADCHSELEPLGSVSGGWEKVRAGDGTVGYLLESILTSREPAKTSSVSAASSRASEQQSPPVTKSGPPPLPPNTLRALAWRAIPWSTTSYYQEPGSSYANCTGQGEWLGNVFQNNLSCTGTNTPAQSIPLTWYHFTIYNLVETDAAYALIACTRNWRWSKCSYLVPGSVFSYRSSNGEVWITAYSGKKGKEKTVKYKLVAMKPIAAR